MDTTTETAAAITANLNTQLTALRRAKLAADALVEALGQASCAVANALETERRKLGTCAPLERLGGRDATRVDVCTTELAKVRHTADGLTRKALAALDPAAHGWLVR